MKQEKKWGKKWYNLRFFQTFCLLSCHLFWVPSTPPLIPLYRRGETPTVEDQRETPRGRTLGEDVHIGKPQQSSPPSTGQRQQKKGEKERQKSPRTAKLPTAFSEKQNPLPPTTKHTGIEGGGRKPFRRTFVQLRTSDLQSLRFGLHPRRRRPVWSKRPHLFSPLPQLAATL